MATAIGAKPGFEKVTKEKFYGVIREKELDVVVSVYGDHHPYIAYFKFRNGRVFGYEDSDGTYYVGEDWV